MAFPDDLPARTDESIGRTKVNTGTYSNTSTQADAGEYNRHLDTTIAIATSLGLPGGSTASSAWQAILGGRGGTQTRTTTGAVSDATHFLAITLSTLPITATVSALTSGSRSLLVYVTGTAAAPEVGDPVVATISLTDGTIFGEAGDLTFEEDGLYWFHGFGGSPTSTWFSRTRLDDIQSEATFQSWVQSFSAGKGFSGGLLNATGPMPDGKVIVVDLTSANITATLPNPPDGYSPWPRELIIIQGAYSLTLNPGASSRINGGALDADYVVPTTTSGIRRVWLTQSGTPGGDDTWYVTSEAKLDEVTATTDALDTRLDAIEANEWVTLVRIAAAVKSAAQGVESLRQIYTSTPAAIGTAAPGSSVLAAAGDHVHAHGSQTDGTHHAAATTSVAGFMSAADKTLIDAITSTSVTSPRFLGSANNTAAAPTFLVEPAGNSGVYWDATKGVVASVDAVDRLMLRVNGTTEISSGTNNVVPALRVTNTLGDVGMYVSASAPEGFIIASIGDYCFDQANGRFYLKVTGTGTGTGWREISPSQSGTYTPTATAVANLDSITGLASMYSRVGDVVTVAAQFTADPTAAGTIVFRFTLPVTSNFAATTDASGACGIGSLIGGNLNVSADATNDAISVSAATGLTTATTVTVIAQYRVL